MITETGGGLSVLILTEPGSDWPTFAGWYSASKMLPEAKVSLVCQRNGETPFQLLQWAKRLKIPVLHRSPLAENFKTVNTLDCVRAAQAARLADDRVLVMRPYTVCLDVLDGPTLERLNSGRPCTTGPVWYVTTAVIEPMISQCLLEGRDVPDEGEALAFEAKETENPASLVGYSKGCGKWIHTSKGCPFSSAAGLVAPGMTTNEHKIIGLWKKMVSLYDAVS